MPSHHGFKRFAIYTRAEVAAKLAPEYPFQPQCGTWGIQGIIRFGEGPNYAFFVTFGQSAGEHQFDEDIDTHGVLRWQSQPAQGFHHQVIRDLLTHEHRKHDILLFLRTRSSGPYTYLGRLQYVAHDAQRVKPVHFRWKILEFDPTKEQLTALQLKLKSPPKTPELPNKLPVGGVTLVKGEKPAGEAGVPLTSKKFASQPIDYVERERRNSKLGRLGEELTLRYERGRLEAAGRPDLAAKVEHISVAFGDGAGYDIRSFDPETGEEVRLEVKTTMGPSTTPFFMSRAERDYARTCPAGYRLYRIYGFDLKQPQLTFFELTPDDLVAEAEFTPVSYEVRLKPAGE